MKSVSLKTAVLESLPTNLNEIEEVRAASAVCDAASEQRQEAEAELEALTSQLEGCGEGTESLMALAERALAGESLADMAIDTVGLVSKIADARRKLRITEAAEKLAGEKADVARSAALAALVPEARAAYAEICERMARSLIQLRADVAQEVKFRDTYLNGYANVKLFPSQIFPMCFHYDDQRVGRLLQEGIDNDLLRPEVMDEFCSLLPSGNWR